MFVDDPVLGNSTPQEAAELAVGRTEVKDIATLAENATLDVREAAQGFASDEPR